MKSNKMFKRTALSVAVGTAFAGITAPAFSQSNSASSIEEVVVTGSRIQRSDLQAVGPFSVVTGEEFKISGNLNIEQKLAELPQTLPSFGPSSNNPGDGTARVDLRGLGDARTLVLVNGRRWVPATQTGVIDLNTIPGTLIEQVDILTGGSSAVYGSDALAGVVNFQLKDDFEGAEITALYDISSKGDAEKFNIDLTIGGNFADGRGNATVYASYSTREALFQGDRAFSDVALTESDGILVPGGSTGIPGTRVFSGPLLSNPNGIIDTIINKDGNEVLDPKGDETFLGTFNQDGTGRSFQDPEDRFNYAPDNFLQLPQDRYLIQGFAKFDVNENLKLYSELAFSNNKVPQELAPTPAFTTVEVNPNSPFFDAATRDAFFSTARVSDTNGDGLINDADDIPFDTNGDGVVNEDDTFEIFIGRRLVEVGSRQSIDTRNAFRILVGASGDINESWGYDVYYTHSSLQRTNVLNGDVSASRFIQGVFVTDDGTECQDPSGGCAPINIFGAGNISQEAVDFIRIGASNITDIEQQVFQASVNGEVGSLASSERPISVALGFESRSDNSSFNPDEFLSSGDVLGFNAGEPTVGGFSVQDYFGEVSVPIAEGLEGIENLEVWGAFRYSDYSNVGGVSSYAFATTYQPVDLVSFRVSFQQAVRAPNVSELFLGSANGFPTATDPCSVAGFIEGTTDRALCEATGLSAAQVGVFKQANSQIEGRFGGNPDLQEEESDTFSIGAIIKPFDGLNITVDYFDISIDNAIDVFGGGVDNTLDICYNRVQDIDSAFCQAITRRPDGNVDTVNVLNANIAAIETSGIDINADYFTNLNWGLNGNDSTLFIQYRSTYLLDYSEVPTIGFSGANKCAGNFGNTCDTPRAEYQFTTRATLTSGAWGLSALVQYIGGTDDDSIENEGVDRSTIVVDSLSPEFYLDISASYEFNENLSVNFGIDNVLDTEPTRVGDVQEQANTFPELYDLIGSRFFVSASYKFSK